jgi:hypothetical protein
MTRESRRKRRMNRRAIQVFYEEDLGGRPPMRMPVQLRLWLTRLLILKPLPSSAVLRRRA